MQKISQTIVYYERRSEGCAGKCRIHSGCGQELWSKQNDTKAPTAGKYVGEGQTTEVEW